MIGCDPVWVEWEQAQGQRMCSEDGKMRGIFQVGIVKLRANDRAIYSAWVGWGWGGVGRKTFCEDSKMPDHGCVMTIVVAAP